MKNLLLSSLAFCSGVFGQLDATTGITFTTWTHALGYKFGLALPETPSTDFIGQLVVPLTNGAGWAGVSLGPSMLNKLLIAVWADDGKIQASFRKASSYGPPPVFSGAFSMKPIAKGTSVNTTHVTYTFLCSKCITGDSLTFSVSDPKPGFGFALSASNVRQPSNPSSPLTYHSRGSGHFDLNIAAAKSSSYGQWAAMAQ